MPQPKIDGVLVALSVTYNAETNLPGAEGIVFFPIHLAPWRQKAEFSLLFFLSDLAGHQQFEIAVDAAGPDGKHLASATEVVPRPDASNPHHWHAVRMAFQATQSGRYALSAEVRFAGADSIAWKRELEVHRDPPASAIG